MKLKKSIVIFLITVLFVSQFSWLSLSNLVYGAESQSTLTRSQWSISLRPTW